jgi:trafficking protein particle complex subunit 1
MLSDPSIESLRIVLRQIYAGAFMEFVVRNPLVGLDSAVTGRGIDNDSFRRTVDGFVRGLTVFD